MVAKTAAIYSHRHIYLHVYLSLSLVVTYALILISFYATVSLAIRKFSLNETWVKKMHIIFDRRHGYTKFIPLIIIVHGRIKNFTVY